MPGWYLHFFYSSDVVLHSRVSLFLYVSPTLPSKLAVFLCINLKGLVPEVRVNFIGYDFRFFNFYSRLYSNINILNCFILPGIRKLRSFRLYCVWAEWGLAYTVLSMNRRRFQNCQEFQLIRVLYKRNGVWLSLSISEMKFSLYWV